MFNCIILSMERYVTVKKGVRLVKGVWSIGKLYVKFTIKTMKQDMNQHRRKFVSVVGLGFLALITAFILFGLTFLFEGQNKQMEACPKGDR